jgi:hypothetical protein
MPSLQILWAVIANPDIAFGIFPHQNLERKSMATLGSANINGVPALGLPKISSLVGAFSIRPYLLPRCGQCIMKERRASED